MIRITMQNKSNETSHIVPSNSTELLSYENVENLPEIDAPQLPEGFYFKVVKIEERSPGRLIPEHYSVEIHKENAGINSKKASSHLVTNYSIVRRNIKALPLNKQNIESAMDKTIQTLIENYRGFKSLYQELNIPSKDDPAVTPELTEAEKFYLGNYKK